MKCKLCGSPARPLFQAQNRHGRHLISSESWPVYECSACCCWFLNVEADDEYYEKYYLKGYYGSSSLLETLIVYPIVQYSFTKRVEIIKGLISHRPIKLLDIGCGDGLFLARLGSDFEISGIEPNPEGQGICRSKHVPVYGSLEETGKKFDVVTLWHVLEHLPEPVAMLEVIIKEHMNPGGKIIIQTPNPGGLGAKLGRARWFHLDSPRHLILYPPRAMDWLAERVGLRIQRVFYTWYDCPLDLFWSAPALAPIYPVLKMISKEHATYILSR